MRHAAHASATRTIRYARAADAPRLAAIYAPYVDNTAISFELTAPDAAVFVERIHKTRPAGAWLVADEPRRGPIGYAYATPYRDRAAYRWTVETSAYVNQDALGQGIGRALYEALFKIVLERGFCTAMAAISLPNPASVAFHERLGFEQVGLFRQVGRKFDTWYDVAWFQRILRTEPL